ncbi:MAG: TIGR00366 family protein [Bryobacteraceae bacterium]
MHTHERPPATGASINMDVAETGGRVARLGVALANWSEKWFPDPLIFAFLGIVAVYLGGLAAGEDAKNLAYQAGKNFWTFVPFTMQMSMVIIGGYVVAMTPLAQRAIGWFAGIPKTPKSAVAMVAFMACTTSLISWGLAPIFCSFLVRALAQRVKGMDYRAASAAAYLGGGSVWALGLSSSAAMLMASKTAMPASLFAISGLIPVTQTLFLWQSILCIVVIVVASTTTAYLSAPSGKNAKTIEDFGIQFEPVKKDLEKRSRPGEWLEYSPILTLCIVAILGWFLAEEFRESPQGPLAALELNIYNLIFLTAALLLHWRPRRFMRAVAESIPAVGGVLIQFPFYAMTFGMIVGTGLSKKLANFFISISSHNTFGLYAAIYSAVLGFFVPSGGTKWVVEAPYVLEAAIAHQVHLGWVVQIYNMAEALPNLVNPFWMLPLLGILKLRARDLIGFTMLQLIVNTPIVFFLCWYFAKNLPYFPPMK